MGANQPPSPGCYGPNYCSSQRMFDFWKAARAAVALACSPARVLDPFGHFISPREFFFREKRDVDAQQVAALVCETLPSRPDKRRRRTSHFFFCCHFPQPVFFLRSPRVCQRLLALFTGHTRSLNHKGRRHPRGGEAERTRGKEAPRKMRAGAQWKGVTVEGWDFSVSIALYRKPQMSTAKKNTP